MQILQPKSEKLEVRFKKICHLLCNGILESGQLWNKWKDFGDDLNMLDFLNRDTIWFLQGRLHEMNILVSIDFFNS